jgi:YspA, cpYpsA-related SLOG family
MRVLVTGGRRYEQAEQFAWSLHEFAEEHGPIREMCQGGASGADRLAKRWAESMAIPCEQMNADWEGPCRPTCRPGHRRFVGQQTICPAAGVYRNQRMLDEFKPDWLVACPGGTGTGDMISRATAAHVPIWYVS